MSSVVDTINGVEFRWNSEGAVTVNGLPVSRAKWEERRAKEVKRETDKLRWEAATQRTQSYKSVVFDVQDAIAACPALFGEG